MADPIDIEDLRKEARRWPSDWNPVIDTAGWTGQWHAINRDGEPTDVTVGEDYDDELAAYVAQLVNKMPTALDEIERLRPLAEALAAIANEAHRIVSHFGSRKLLSKGVTNQTIGEKLAANLLLADDIDRIALDVFERAVTALAKAGHPGAQVHMCNPLEEP